MTYGTIVERKLANALFAGAEPSGAVPDFVSDELHRFKKKQGGLWVGGTATLTDTHFLFAANELNEKLHTGNQSFAIPLGEIADVAVEFGWLTKIIVVTTRDGGTRRVRCFGAKDLAEKIRKQAGLG